MMFASRIAVSSRLRNLCENINGFRRKVTLRKQKQTQIVAGSLLRALEVDCVAIQEPHFVTAGDHQIIARCSMGTVWMGHSTKKNKKKKKKGREE